MIKSDKDSLLWYIEELLLSEKDIVVLSDNNGIINLKVNGRSFFLYIKSLTYAGNPYPLNTTRAQLPSRDDFKSIKDSNAIFLFLGYDEENEVFACWEPTKTKARLNEKQYVSFFSRLHLQVIAKEKDFVKASLQNGLKYVLFRLDVLPKFLLTIDDFFPDIISYGLPETPEINQGKIFDLEDDSSIVSFIEELYKNDTNDSILSLVSSCINKFGKTYYNMTLRDWQILVSEYIEQKHPSISEDDEIEEKITDLIETENKRFLVDVNNSRQLSNILKSEVLPESSEGFRDYLNKILSYPNFSLEETKELFKRYYDGDKKAFDLLVKSNLKIVVNIACLFRNCGASLEDLIQVGSMGLINAIKFYRNKDGANFNSYIRFGIYAFISDSTLKLPYLLTLHARIVDEHIKYRRLFDEFVRKNDYPPSIYDIDLGEDVGIKRKIFLSQLPPDFRDAICFIEDYDSFEDTTNMPDDGLMEESTRIYVQGLLSLLSDREGKILQYSFGLNGTTPESLEQIGYKIGLTRERVRQIREKAMRKLKNLLGVNRKKAEESSSKEKKKQIILTDNIIEQRGYSYLYKNKKNESPSPQYKIREAWDPSFYEYLKQHAINQAQKEQENKKTLKEIIIHFLQQNNYPMLLQGITLEVNRRSPGIVYRHEDVKNILDSLPEVDSWSGGWYRLRQTNQSGSRTKSYIIKTKKTKNELKTSILNETPSSKTGNFTYNLSTPLLELVKQKIITKTEHKHCKYKELWTIGDVKEKIEKYNLTPTSTRFTQYTIDLWFKIVGLLEPSTKVESLKEEPIKETYKTVNLPNPSGTKLDELYVKYFLMIENVHQAHRDGHANVAKPVFLLAIIEGIEKGEIKDNKIVIDDQLENSYMALMKIYSNLLIFKNITPINMPFWHLESDGFWHLNIKGGKMRYVTPTTKWLKENVLYASFDKDLWILLENQEWRTKLRNFVIKHKLSAAEE